MNHHLNGCGAYVNSLNYLTLTYIHLGLVPHTHPTRTLYIYTSRVYTGNTEVHLARLYHTVRYTNARG